MTADVAGILADVAQAAPAAINFAEAVTQAKSTADRVAAVEAFAAQSAAFLAWMFPQHNAPSFAAVAPAERDATAAPAA